MKTDEEAVDKIFLGSNEIPQRIVVDEVLPSGLMRILSAEARSDRKRMKLTDSAAWTEEKEHYVDKKRFRRLLPEDYEGDISEGEVFYIRNERSQDVRDNVRKGMKKKAQALLAWEGHEGRGKEEGR